MGKVISNIFLAALALGLSVFTGSRTLDLLAWALPANQIIYQWLGLAAYEGGMYFWSFYFVSGAKGVHQRSISLIMAVFSVAAVCIATVADLSLEASQSGKIAPLNPGMQQAMIVFVGVTVALNVAAFLACKLMSPEKLREIASGQAEDLIYAEGLRAIGAMAPSVAADAAPYLAAEWSNRTWQRIVPGVQRSTQYLGPVGAAVPALPAGGAPESRPLQSPTRYPHGDVRPPDYISGTLDAVTRRTLAPAAQVADAQSPTPSEKKPRWWDLRPVFGRKQAQETATLAQEGKVEFTCMRCGKKSTDPRGWGGDGRQYVCESCLRKVQHEQALEARRKQWQQHEQALEARRGQWQQQSPAVAARRRARRAARFNRTVIEPILAGGVDAQVGPVPTPSVEVMPVSEPATPEPAGALAYAAEKARPKAKKK